MKSKELIVVIVGAALFLAPMASNSQSPSNQEDLKQPTDRSRALQQKKKQERDEALKELKARIDPLTKYTIEELQLAVTIKVITMYGGSKVYANDDEHTYLGAIEDEFSSDSIFNEFGRYGSEYNARSIWNQFGTFGGEFSSYSPFNGFSTNPPFIVKGNKIIGRLTVNKFVAGAVDPKWLRQYFKY